MRRPGSHTWVLVVLCSATAVTIASVTSLYAATGDIAKDLGTTQAEIAWVLDAYTLVLAGLLLPAAALGDRIGRRRVMTIGLVIFTIAAAAAQLVNTPDQLIADRAALGLGAALILPTTLSLITSTFPAELRDRSVAIWAATFSAAGGLGGALAAFLLEFFSWRSAFWSALIGAVLVLAATPTLPESREENAPRLDAAGALTATAAILLLVYGLIEAGVRGWGDDSILAAFVLSAVAFALFITIELRREHPLLDVRLFTQRALSVAFVLVMVAFSAAFAIAFLIIPYQQVVLGDGALGASLAMACMAIPVVAVTPVVGRLADRFGVRTVLAVGCLCDAAGFGLLLLSDLDGPWWLFYIITAWIGLGLGLIGTPATNAIIDSLPTAKQGIASSLNHTARELGIALGVGLCGGLMASGYGNRIAAATAALHGPARAASRDSAPAALQVAAGLRSHRHGHALAHAARAAFADAARATSLVMLFVMLGAALLAVLARPRVARPIAVLDTG